jgi:hypothetical protein
VLAQLPACAKACIYTVWSKKNRQSQWQQLVNLSSSAVLCSCSKLLGKISHMRLRPSSVLAILTAPTAAAAAAVIASAAVCCCCCYRVARHKLALSHHIQSATRCARTPLYTAAEIDGSPMHSCCSSAQRHFTLSRSLSRSSTRHKLHRCCCSTCDSTAAHHSASAVYCAKRVSTTC